MFLDHHSAQLVALSNKIDAYNAKIISTLQQIEKEQAQLMALVTVDSAQIDAINTAVQGLKADTATALADIAAKIASLQTATPDPATATELGNILTSILTLDASVKSADPGAVTPVEPPSGS